eukprot:jgi/Ulvmu1/225/UM001_0229.1
MSVSLAKRSCSPNRHYFCCHKRLATRIDIWELADGVRIKTGSIQSSRARLCAQAECMPSFSASDYEAVVAGAPGPDEAQWVFGYGSIVFRPGFTPGEKVSGCIHGWKRMMYQNSTDHRGVPGKPGRTATIIPEDGSSTWGIAFKLPEDTEERRKALRELEWREKQYDQKVFTDVFDEAGNVLVAGALIYVATSDTSKNVNWGGPRSDAQLAKQIFHARGPSGPNYEYLFGMAQGLRDIGEHAHDDHIFGLETLVREMMADNGTAAE